MQSNEFFQSDISKTFESVPDEAVLSPGVIAELLCRSNETIRRWCRSGRLPSYSFGGKYIIIGEDFKRFMKQAKTGSKELRDLFE